MRPGTDADDSPRVLGRLTHYLIIKSILEPVLLCVLVVGFHLTTFNAHFRGRLDEANPERISGWAIDQSSPDAHVEVQLYIDDRFVESRSADLARPDLTRVNAAWGERHGFSFLTPPLAPGTHEARVYGVHKSGGGKRRTSRLIGTIRFTVQE